MSGRGRTKRGAEDGGVAGGMQRKEEKFSLCRGLVLKMCVRDPSSGAAG